MLDLLEITKANRPLYKHDRELYYRLLEDLSETTLPKSFSSTFRKLLNAIIRETSVFRKQWAYNMKKPVNFC
ncbi:hypothetical protein LMRF06_2179 [Listeria monocytogenes]|nr:hypothetical protein LMRF06_2179 [Listeria monocytogenes]